MEKMVVYLILVFVVHSDLHVKAQSTLGTGNSPNASDAVSNFKPSLSIAVGILCIMFMLTFIIIVYAKFCHRGSLSIYGGGGGRRRHGLRNLLPSSRSTRFSGIDKTVIESLPFFKFSSLKGTKHGLECSVCLSKFEDIEVLRLLPKCKHAFHIDCIDQWLEKHSSCPLCRHKVSAEDSSILGYTNSMRFYNVDSELKDDSNMEIFVQREEEENNNNNNEVNKEDEALIVREFMLDKGNKNNVFHKFNHKIVVSDVVFKNRWSNVSSSDLMFLNSEMLNSISSCRFSDKEGIINDDWNNEFVNFKVEMDMKKLFERRFEKEKASSSSSSVFTSNSRKIISSTERKSVSEITALPRFSRFNIMRKNKNLESPSCSSKRRMIWLPIVRTTVQWFANRERKSQHTTHHLDV